MTYTRTYPGRGYTAPDYKGTLWLNCLTPEQKSRTCGYWYTVTDGSTAHTAFRTRAALMAWLKRRCLRLTADLPNEGEHSSQRIDGSYRTELHMDTAEFFALPGFWGREMSNGEYTLAIYANDPDGIVTVHTLNPNVSSRPVYDHQTSREMEDMGLAA